MLASAPGLVSRLALPLGYGLLALGVVMIVLPGPGLPFLVGGLALVGRRQAWARRAVRGLKVRMARMRRSGGGGRGRGRALGLLLLATGAALPGAARGATPWLDVEAGAVGSGYNDVRIPGDTGTRFSLTDDLTTASAPYFRVRAGVALGRHEVWGLYAPLSLDARGTAPADLDFFGTTFPAGTPLRGTYRFDSYRLGWRYALWQRPTFELAVGVTAKIRDAAITVCAAECTVRSNTGFVPLGNVKLHWRFAGPVGLYLEADALAGGPGRAEDVTLALTYRAAENVTLRVGGRVVEGGADTDSVYNFALLAYGAAGLTVTF